MVGDFAIEEPVMEETTETIVETVEEVVPSAGTSTPSEPIGTAEEDKDAFAAAALGDPFISRYHNTGNGNGAQADLRNSSEKAAKASAQHMANAMVQTAMTAAQQEAYNNPITLQIGGKKVEMKQGDLHKAIQIERIAVEKRVKMQRKNGQSPSAADLEMLKLLKDAEDASNPDFGPMDQDRLDRVNKAIENNPDLQTSVRQEWLEGAAKFNNTERTEAFEAMFDAADLKTVETALSNNEELSTNVKKEVEAPTEFNKDEALDSFLEESSSQSMQGISAAADRNLLFGGASRRGEG